MADPPIWTPSIPSPNSISGMESFCLKRVVSKPNGRPAAFGSPFAFKRHGQSGLPVSELFPHVAKHADDLCVIRSMQADVPNHEPSLMLMNCGENQLVRPSMGSWVTYGLGTENNNLPGFVVLCPNGYPVTENPKLALRLSARNLSGDLCQPGTQSRRGNYPQPQPLASG